MIRCAILLSSLLILMPESVTAAEKGWQAGVAKVNISPELPIWLSGYGGRNKPAATKHDDLWAKALVIEDAAGHRAAIVTMDLVGIPRELSQAVSQQIEERYKLPRASIVLCASHTHSGPVVRGNLMAMYALDEDQSRRISEYKTKLVENLVQVVSDAIDSIQPAKLSWGIGEAGFAVNRRNNVEGKVVKLRQDFRLVGPVDHELPVLAVRGADDKLRAIVAGYACHATVVDGYAISADWPGAGQNELERRHPGAIALFVAGCGGDQNPLPRRSFDYVNQYGNEFADGVDAAQSALKPIAPSLKTAYEEIDLPFAALPTRAELEITATEKKPQGPWAKYLLAQWDRDGKLPASYPYPIQGWKLGSDLTWLFLGGEVVVDYSLRLKTELGPGKTWVASYSNDVMGYIPSRRVLGEGGYEGGLARFPYGLPAPWDGKVEQLIVNKAHELAAEISGAK
jgi:Neutral/alkaline non-lysosomal ceramidase, N-terminal